MASKLEEAYREVDTSKALAVQLDKLVTLEQAIAGLETLKTDLEQQLSQAIFDKDTKDQALEANRAKDRACRRGLINRGACFATPNYRIIHPFEASKIRIGVRKHQIRNLGKRLNAALAQRVQNWPVS